MSGLHPLQFVDVNCTVGPHHNPFPGSDWSPDALLRKMDDLGIAEACPATLVGRDYHPREGNDWLAAHVPATPRLHPVWTVATHHSGEFPAPAALLDEMRAHGVQMLRLFLYPWSFLDRLDTAVLGELFDALDAQRIPLLIDVADATLLSARDLEVVLKAWPHLPIIVSISKPVRNERWFSYLWERYDTLRMDLPGYQVLHGIEGIVRRFGPHRVVYGSRYPTFTPLQSMLQVIYAEIDEPAKRAIAGGTMRQLLQEVRL